MKRVVITGMGCVTPLGNSLNEFWENSIGGLSGCDKITKFDATKFKTQIACEVKMFDPSGHLTHNEIKRSDLFTQYALYSSLEALQDSGLELSSLSPFDIGVIWGSGQGGMGTFEDEIKNYAKLSEPRFSPFFVPRFITNMASGMISMKFGLMGINYTAVSACATANSAIMDAFNYIKIGKAKAFICGASEAGITEASIGGFNAMKALSTNNENPKSASRPFDKQRDGFVMGEGSGALVLEEYEFAKKRGARIYAEIVGAAMTADAYHMTATHPEGIGAARAMELALKEAGIKSTEVGYLNAHATSTSIGDKSEMVAVQKVFGNDSKNLKISSTKSMTGHLLGAAGAIEAILSVKAIEKNIVPPTINSQYFDADIPNHEKIVKNEAEQHDLSFALSNSFGFGGHNAVVVFKKV